MSVPAPRESDLPSDDTLSFLSEDSSDTGQGAERPKPWRVLSIDDDKDFQQSLAFTLSKRRILGREIELLQAYDFVSASALLSQNRDISVALVDVVMDTDDAGLRLVKAIREVLGNAEIRLVLLTGQPGLAPRHSIMANFDINDYWTKTELNAERLETVLTANVRAYLQICEINKARKGMQLIVESGNALNSSLGIRDFSSKMLEEIGKLVGAKTDGLVCVQARDDATETEAGFTVSILSATGKFRVYLGKTLDDLEDEAKGRIFACLKEKRTSVTKDYTCFYCSDERSKSSSYVAYFSTSVKLDSTALELLKVFLVNIDSGLQNVFLFSRLEKIAYEDSLVKIPNRNALLRALDNNLSRTQHRSDQVLLVLDIDKFASINTVLGSEFGDSFLKDFTSKLKAGLDPLVMVARLKDDSFALLGPRGILSTDIVDAIFNDRNLSSDLLYGINFGAVEYPLEHAKNGAVEVLSTAIRALKRAKQKGIRQRVVYSPLSEDEEAKQFHLLNKMQAALGQRQFSILLQPQVDLKSGKAVGVEVLARWKNSDGTYVPPNDFIPVAEASGLIVQLGGQVLDLACAAGRRLADEGFGDLRVGVNFSGLQLEQDGIVERILGTMSAHGLKMGTLEVEVTESIAMQGFKTVIHKFEYLRKLGLSIAIDDFGTGFSSLSYLSTLPADRLKIDKSFVDKIPGDVGAETIAQTIINLGENFNLSVIAEGVESKDQLDWLKAQGCSEVQGYYFSKALDLESLIPWLKEKNHEAA